MLRFAQHDINPLRYAIYLGYMTLGRRDAAVPGLHDGDVRTCWEDSGGTFEVPFIFRREIYGRQEELFPGFHSWLLCVIDGWFDGVCERASGR